MIARLPSRTPDRDPELSDAARRPGWHTTEVSGLTWLRLSISTRADHAIVTLAGELDIAATGALDSWFSTLVSAGITRIVADLADLVFCDACGLGILARAADRARRRGGWLRIAAPGPPIDRIIGITNLTRV